MDDPTDAGADASTSNKRASGRVRKQPEHYAASPFGASGKRKRPTGDDGDEGDPELEDEDDDDEDEDDDEPDEEEVREQRKKIRKAKAAVPEKPAQKKPKVNGTSLPIRDAAKVSKKAPPRRKVAAFAADATAAGGLYAEIFAGGERVEDIASQWLQRFTYNEGEHESSALAEIVNLVLRCAGCDGTVEQHDIEDPDAVTNKLDDLREAYQASNPTDYPIIGKTKGAATFKQTITSFMRALVRAVAAKGLINTQPELIENMQVWFSTMSSAPNPSFRHTATVVSLAIVSELCEVAAENAREIASTKRHAETEQKKKSANKARVKLLEQQASERHAEQEMLEAMLKDWFDVIFIHRYRDVNPLIRRECVAALGDWIASMPDMFFDGNHLRYLGWVLSDTNAATRGEVIKQLHRLYQKESNIGGLRTFTEKFRERLVEIATSDADSSVRTSAIALLNVLRAEAMLEPDDIDAVGRLVFDTDVRVRKAVAGYFAENVNDLYTSKTAGHGGLEALEEKLPEVADDDYESPQLSWLKFKSLAETFESYDADEDLPSNVERTRDGRLTLHVGRNSSRVVLAADALYDAIEEMQDWQSLAGYIIAEKAVAAKKRNSSARDGVVAECVLSDRENIILLEVLNANVRRWFRDAKDKLQASKGTNKMRAEWQEERKEAAQHLAGLIPKLLKKFGDNPSTAAAVLRIETTFGLPYVADIRPDTATCSAVLDDVRKQFLSHSTDEVLEPATDAIFHARLDEKLDDVAEDKITELWENVTANLVKLVDPRAANVRGLAESDQLAALSDSLLRITRLSAISDCIAPLEDNSVVPQDAKAANDDLDGAIDYILALVQRAVPDGESSITTDNSRQEDEVAARAAEASLLYFCWKLKEIGVAVTDSASAGVPDDDLQNLAVRRDRYVDSLRAVLEVRRPGDEVSLAIAQSLLDLFSFAAFLKTLQPNAGVSDDYMVLAMSMDNDLQKLVLKVFGAAEKKYAKISGRKLDHGIGAAAVEDDEDEDAINEDPASDPESSEDEDEDEDDEQTQTQGQPSQRKEAKMLTTLLAEQSLCTLVSKFVKALAADVIDAKTTRRRLERNKAKLGPNFKACCEWLNVKKVQQKGKGKAGAVKTKGKAVPNGNGQPKAKAAPKSNAIVAEDEEEEEIEDPEEGDDEEALRRRGLVEEGAESEPEAGNAEVGGAQEEEEQSVLGD